MPSLNDLHVGDLVQVKVGAVDITNNKIATASSKYIEGSSQWATVERLEPNWYGMEKVRLISGNTVVWQVKPSDISSNVIHSEIPPQTNPAPLPVETSPTAQGIVGLTETLVTRVPTASLATYAFAPSEDAQSWRPTAGSREASRSIPNTNPGIARSIPVGTAVSTTQIDSVSPSTYGKPGDSGFVRLSDEERISKKIPDILMDKSIVELTGLPDMMTDINKRRELLKDNQSIIQNDKAFPHKIQSADYKNMFTAEYDYRIETGRTRVGSDGKTQSLANRLIEARAALGLPVHGDSQIAKTMRYFMYNRYKTPDTNLAHNKSFTHIFFTRPDLNILTRGTGGVTVSDQCRNHTESSMIWMRNPYLFQMLVDKDRIGDTNNFNMLLSNAITSFNIEDENLSTNEAGRTWNEYTMQYGDAYTGRSGGEFSVSFTDDKLYSIINMLKLWMTYIDNVSRGAWVPSYDLMGALRNNQRRITKSDSHVYTKTLDYAASAYVFKLGEDGSDILYWSKYYGVFPINTGASALSWDLNSNPGEPLKLNIRFKYSFKRDMNPVSLLEFNRVAGISGWSSTYYDDNFNPSFGHSTRPYSGTPFIELQIPNGDPAISAKQASLNEANLAEIRLRFQPGNSSVVLTDKQMYHHI